MLNCLCAAVLVLLLLLAGDHPALVAQTTTQAAVPTQQRTGSVTGTVYDSVAGAPLARAVVQLLAVQPATDSGGSPRSAPQPVYTATTDSSGHYEMPRVAPGNYHATFFHPAVDALGLVPVLYLLQVQAGRVTHAELAVPSPASIWAATCPVVGVRDSTGLLVGHVRDAETGEPIAGGTVTVGWNELVFVPPHGVHLVHQQTKGTTNAAGLYAICGLPTDGDVGAQATHGAARSGTVAVAIPRRGVLETDLSISSATSQVVLKADSAGLDSGTVLLKGTATLAGTVRSETGQPMAGVELRLLGTGVRGRTDRNGAFRLTNLPAGSYMLETRRLGLAPARVAVALVSHRTTQTTVRVGEAAVLSKVTVYGKRNANRQMKRLSEFLQRKRVGWGTFLTRADIDRRQPFETTDLFHGIPNMKMVSGDGYKKQIFMRGGMAFCQPDVYVDGIAVFRTLGASGGVTTGDTQARSIQAPSLANGIGAPSVDSSMNTALGAMETAGEIDEYITPKDIAAVEVYPNQMATPAQFRSHNCGSIVIWSRYAFPEQQAKAGQTNDNQL
jgi:hypothetical protein